MDAFFYLVPTIMLVVVGWAAFTVVRRSRRISSAWDSGLTAEARCLRTYTTTRSSTAGDHHRMRTVLHHVYEFTTRDGRTVRFEEENGPGTTLEGDIVTVHYVADRPEEATALPPTPGKLMAQSGATLVFLGLFAAACIAFMISAHTVFDLAGGVFDGSGGPDGFYDIPDELRTP